MAWPTTDDPRTEFVTLRFTVSEAADLDWYQSHIKAASRSEAVRDCVDKRVSAAKVTAARQKSRRERDKRRLDEDDD